jgi:hypothetical protein
MTSHGDSGGTWPHSWYRLIPLTDGGVDPMRGPLIVVVAGLAYGGSSSICERVFCTRKVRGMCFRHDHDYVLMRKDVLGWSLRGWYHWPA